MSKSELQANLSAAHLIGHIQYFYEKAEAQGDKMTAKMHLNALIRACELNPSFSHWKETYNLKLKSYE